MFSCVGYSIWIPVLLEIPKHELFVLSHYNDDIMRAMASHQPHDCLLNGLFTQRYIQAHVKENIKAPRHWLLCGEFPAQRASNAENVSIW